MNIGAEFSLSFFSFLVSHPCDFFRLLRVLVQDLATECMELSEDCAELIKSENMKDTQMDLLREQIQRRNLMLLEIEKHHHVELVALKQKVFIGCIFFY